MCLLSMQKYFYEDEEKDLLNLTTWSTIVEQISFNNNKIVQYPCKAFKGSSAPPILSLLKRVSLNIDKKNVRQHEGVNYYWKY